MINSNNHDSMGKTIDFRIEVDMFLHVHLEYNILFPLASTGVGSVTKAGKSKVLHYIGRSTALVMDNKCMVEQHETLE